jgi:SAM-dependent methyltransferase
MKPKAFTQFAELERDHWWFRGRRALYIPMILQHLEGRKPKRALDLGAGVGGWLESLGAIVQELYFSEIDSNAAQLAQKRGQARGIRASVEHLPLQASSADLLSLFDVLEHIQNDALALSEAHRVLEPGGLLVLSVPAHPWLFSRNDLVAGHVRRYTRSQLMTQVEKAGFRIERCTFVNSLLFPLITLLVLASKALQKLSPGSMDDDHTNLSWPMPRWLNSALFWIFRSELAWLKHAQLPFGHSLFLIGVKDADRRE